MNKTEAPEELFGIRVSLPANDPFNVLLDEGWHTEHWYHNRIERDRALREMSRVHEYSRKSDAPTLVFKPIDRADDS